MKKRRLPIIATSLMSLLFLGSCAETLPPENEQNYAHYYLVSFYVDNDLYRTARVKEGETIGEIIEAPTKDDYNFVGWQTSDGVAFDLATSTVNSSLSLYANFELISKPSTGEDESTLNVTDTKDPTKDYYLVIGWYGKTETSGLDVSLMQHFYANARVFMRAKGVSEEDLGRISVRQYGGADTGVADMGAFINADADVDLVVGVGNNINSTAGVEIIEKAGEIPMGGKSRFIARLTENEMAKSLYDFIVTDTGKQMFDESFVLNEADIPENPAESTSNVEDVRDPNKTYSLVVGWYGRTSKSYVTVEIMEHFYSNLKIYLETSGVSDDDINAVSIRRYGDESTQVGPMADLVKDDGDVDVLVGVGGSYGDLTALETIEDIPMGGSERNIIRLSEDEIGKNLCSFISTTDAGKKMFDETFTLTPEDVTK